MKSHPDTRRRAMAAFTLIELLVVIAVIGILAALLLPVTGAMKIRAARSKAKAELNLIVIAIESYKDKYGHYPPDVPTKPVVPPNWPRVNQLYFELMGARFVNNQYETLDGSARIAASAVPTTFGAGVTGFINCTRAANADDAPPAKTFLVQLKPAQYGETVPGSGILLLACSVPWPENNPFTPVPGNPGLNPWRYVSSNPTNNPGVFDLWVDLFVGGKINRVSNWSDQAQIVNTSF